MKYIFLLLFIFSIPVFSNTSVEVDSVAPNFSGYTASDTSIQLSDYIGKVVLIDFWASWCGPCRKEMPFLVELHEQFRKFGFEIIAINIDDEIKNMQGFISKLEKKPAFPILIDHKKKNPELYEIKAMPTTIFVDKKGKIRFWHNGFKESHQEKYIRELKTLLNEK